MIELTPRACRRHRSTLLEFVDRGMRASEVDLALDHLAGCTACRRELESTALTIAALRRLSRSVAGVEPSSDAWVRLRARIRKRRRTTWSSRMQIGALVASAWMVAVVGGGAVMVSPGNAAVIKEPDGTSAAYGRAGDPIVRAGTSDEADSANLAFAPSRWVSPDNDPSASSPKSRSGPEAARQVTRR